MPKWKLDALKICKMGVFCKILVKFDKSFWGKRKNFFIANEKKGYYPYWMGLKETIAMCIVVGDEAKRIELM